MRGRGRTQGAPPTPETQPRTGVGRGRGLPNTPLAPAPSQSTQQPSEAVGESADRGRPVQPEFQQQQPQFQQPLQPTESRGYSGGNGGNGAAKRDRGSVRGRTFITDIIRTKPQNVQSKKGTSGQPVTLLTNYFRLLKQPDWQLYQYRVDFSPPVELRGLRNRLIFEQKAVLGGYLFDGTLLFLSVKLPEETTQFMSSDRDGHLIQTTVKFTNRVDMTTAISVQILNLILRRSMEALKLQLVGRNFFDAIAKIDIPQHQLQLWPGYLTSIRQHESDIMLCAEITNKVMRTETLYDILQNCVQNERTNYKDPFKNVVLGMTVLTAYNNKTYCIDDVDFDKSPSDTFATREGDITFMQYYRDKYQLTIRDPGQPLLISKLKERDLRGGQTENILLIPELCRATGLTDNMRSDHRLMSAVAIYTRLAPKARVERLNAFNQRLQNTTESVNNFKEWNFVLDKDMVQVNGRQLPNEKILFGGNKMAVTNQEADWSREFRNISMYTAMHLKKWVVIVPQRKRREAEDFIGILQKAGVGMRYEIAKPTIKLGGAPWMVEIPKAGLMVVGYDVCHDAKDKSKSYGAIVATMDMKVSQNYFSAVTAHTNGEELSNQLLLNMVKALNCFKGQHNALPDRIVFYRDGVGEGQTNYVLEHEVKNMLERLNDIYANAGAQLKFHFVVVSKRINTRFFRGAVNPNPGTVVDDVVTLPERYDFFLNSQFVRNGTVSPTNYNVIYETPTSALTPDQMQRLSYKMTHLYYNWSGTLAIPAVCQYAHKLAFLVGNFIHQTPSHLLEKQLYFL
ncbi:protein aubergine-like isoform X2 [Bradysia coprophila]|uniref:protein aubergine-like isoform X2 n=1 Tax=Bradysia coprophila TaxID=38358 RepID=UPI00187DAD3F|nr:protein aubergine-like isoform X2 [Bradysia coprophila]